MHLSLIKSAAIRLTRWLAVTILLLSTLQAARAVQSAPSAAPSDPSQSIINYLLGITTDPAGLDLNNDSAVTVADLLCAIRQRPVTVTSFTIAGGAVSTSSRSVTLTSTFSGEPPAFYMASESPTFSGAAWLPYAASLPFTLSTGNMSKGVYFKVKTQYGVESAVVSHAITLLEITPLTVGAAPSPGLISPVGDYDFFQISVPATSFYVVETFPGSLTDDYLRLYGPGSMTTQVAEDHNSGSAHTARVALTLSPGTYYARVQANNPATTGTYTIQATDIGVIKVNSFSINGGASVAATPSVTLTSSCSGNPAYYMVSESPTFTGVAWHPYAASVPFTLSAGNLPKQVYFKVKNAYDAESSPASAAITLQQITPLTVGAAAVSGYVTPAGDSDWFQFTAGAASTFAIDTFPGALTDVTMSLYGPGNMTTLVAQDHNSGTSGMARIALPVAAGTYYVKVQAYSAAATGDYTIKVSDAGTLKINSFKVNNDASITYNRAVVLNSSCSGAPTQYMASEASNFSGASWRAYDPATSFTLSSGNADKKVYFKVKDASGAVTSAISDKITLKEMTPLATDGTIGGGTIAVSNDQNWYSFTVATAGLYTIQTYAGSLNDTQMGLTTNPNAATAADWLIKNDNVDKSNLMSMISAWLTPGTYYVMVLGGTSALTGTYTIRVWQPTVTKLTLNGTAASGYVTASTDALWYQFTITNQGLYSLVTVAGTLTEGQIELYSGAGVKIGQNTSPDDTTMPGLSAALVAGTYLVRFVPVLSSDQGTFTVKALSGAISGGVLSLQIDGAIASGFLHNPSLYGGATDTNYYQLIIPATGTYSILTHAGTLGQATLTLIDEAGQQYATSGIGSMPQIQSMTLNAGIYQITMTGYYTTDWGSYQIAVVSN